MVCPITTSSALFVQCCPARMGVRAATRCCFRPLGSRCSARMLVRTTRARTATCAFVPQKLANCSAAVPAKAAEGANRVPNLRWLLHATFTSFRVASLPLRAQKSVLRQPQQTARREIMHCNAPQLDQLRSRLQLPQGHACAGACRSARAIMNKALQIKITHTSYV